MTDTMPNEMYQNAESQLVKAGIRQFEYQIEGTQWMIQREIDSCGGFLFDDAGLGKTCQTLGLILGHIAYPTLIVMPIALLEQWRELIAKVAPQLVIHTHRSKKPIPLDANIVLTGYHRTYSRNTSMAGDECCDRTPLHEIKWGRIVLDECHMIRSKRTRLFRGCAALKSTYRWGLSGTPIHNRLSDLRTVFAFAQLPLKVSVSDHTQTAILRRNKSLVAEKYRNLKINIVNIPFDTEEEREYCRQLRKECRRRAAEIIAQCGDQRRVRALLMVLIMRLRQANIHPNIVELAKPTPRLIESTSTKMRVLMEMVNAQSADHKTLIVCHFREEMAMVKRCLERNFRVGMYSGGMNFESRNQCIADCHAGKIDVLVIQIVCGGVGLNLQMFNKVYMLTPNWNPANEIQAIARCHRIGQTRDVEVFKLVIADDTMETIDQRIIRVQQRKRGIMSHYLNDVTFDFNEVFRNENCSKQEFSLGDCMELM